MNPPPAGQPPADHPTQLTPPPGGPASDVALTQTHGPSAAGDATSAEVTGSWTVDSVSGSTQQVFGNYVILHELARGGMGVVFKARQRAPNRDVALKMILTGTMATEQDRERFRREADAAARVHHPHIVAVYEVSEVNGQPYFSMEYLPGPSLEARVHAGPLPPREAAELIKKLSRAVDHAHKEGIVHRDLKPANVLFDDLGEPRLTDFGLARVAGEQALTATGQILGTPGYMAPEQASGRTADVGPAADIYALGGILYALLTGQPPFRGDSLVTTLRLVVESPPVSPRSLNGQIPIELEAIVLKCLEKSPAKRYATAGDLAQEIDRWLGGQTVEATLSRPRGWRQLVFQPAVLIAVCLVIAAVIAITQWPRTNPYLEVRRQEIKRLVDRALESPPYLQHEPHPSRRSVKVLPGVNTTAFEPLERLHVWDFRAWKEIPAGKENELWSPVALTSHERLRKLKPVDEYMQESRISGVDVFSICDSHPDFVELAEETPSLVGGQKMKSRLSLINISKVPVGGDFSIDIRRTYWNGFHREDQRWVGTIVRHKQLKVGFLVIMPTDKPFRTYKLRMAELDGENIKPFPGEQLVITGPKNDYLFWEIVHPEPNYVYRADWEW